MYTYDFYTDPYLFNYAVRSAAPYGDDLIMTIRAKLFNTSSINKPPKASQIMSEEYTKEHFDELLPMAVRYYHSSPAGKCYLVERPPFQCKIDYSKNSSHHVRKYDKSVQGKDIWMPWTVMAIYIPNNCRSFGGITFRLHFNNAPLSSLEDTLIPSFLPNSGSSGGNICIGAALSSINYDSDNPLHIKEIAHTIYNDYFSGGWNSDISNVILYNQAMLPALRRLEEKSEKSYTCSNLPEAKIALEANQHENYHHRSYSLSYVDFFYCYSEMTFEEVFDYFSLLKNYYTYESRYDSSTAKELVNGSSNRSAFSSIYLSDRNASMTYSSSTLSYLHAYSQSLSNNYRSIDVNVAIRNFKLTEHSYFDFIAHSEIIRDSFIYLFDSFSNNNIDTSQYAIFGSYDANNLYLTKGNLNALQPN